MKFYQLNNLMQIKKVLIIKIANTECYKNVKLKDNFKIYRKI